MKFYPKNQGHAIQIDELTELNKSAPLINEAILAMSRKERQRSHLLKMVFDASDLQKIGALMGDLIPSWKTVEEEIYLSKKHH